LPLAAAVAGPIRNAAVPLHTPRYKTAAAALHLVGVGALLLAGTNHCVCRVWGGFACSVPRCAAL